MAVIHIPRRTYSQPQGRVDVNFNGDFGRLARFLVNYADSSHDLVYGLDHASTKSSFVKGVGSWGVGLAANGQSGLYYAGEYPAVEQPDVTVVVVSESTGGGNGGWVMSRSNGSTPNQTWALGTHRGSSDGWAIEGRGIDGGISGQPLVNIGDALSSQPVAQVLTLGAGTTETKLFVNGVFAGSRASVGELDYVSLYPGLTVIRNKNGAASNFRGIVYAVAVLEKALPDYAAAELSANPWQLLTTKPTCKYYLPLIQKTKTIPPRIWEQTTKPQKETTLSPEWSKADFVLAPSVYGDKNPTGGSFDFIQKHPSTIDRFGPTGVRLVADHAGSNDDKLAFLGIVPTLRYRSGTFLYSFEIYDSGTDLVYLIGGDIGLYAQFTSGQLRLGYNARNGFDYILKNNDGVSYDRAGYKDKKFTFVVSVDRDRRKLYVAATCNGRLIPFTYHAGQENYITQGVIGTTSTNPHITGSSHSNYYHFNGVVDLWAYKEGFIGQQEAEDLAQNPWKIFKHNVTKQIPIRKVEVRSHLRSKTPVTQKQGAVVTNKEVLNKLGICGGFFVGIGDIGSDILGRKLICSSGSSEVQFGSVVGMYESSDSDGVYGSYFEIATLSQRRVSFYTGDPSSQSFTMLCRLRLNKSPTSSDVLFRSGQFPGSGSGETIPFWPLNNQFDMRIAGMDYSANGVWELGKWYDLAIVGSNDSCVFYVNGVQIIAGSSPFLRNLEETISFGELSGGNISTGDLDIRFFIVCNKPLSELDVNTFFANPFVLSQKNETRMFSFSGKNKIPEISNGTFENGVPKVMIEYDDSTYSTYNYTKKGYLE